MTTYSLSVQSSMLTFSNTVNVSLGVRKRSSGEVVEINEMRSLFKVRSSEEMLRLFVPTLVRA